MSTENIQESKSKLEDKDKEKATLTISAKKYSTVADFLDDFDKEADKEKLVSKKKSEEEIRKQEIIRDIAKKVLGQMGITNVSERGDNPYVLTFDVNGKEEEPKIERALYRALKPDSPYALNVKVDSDLMGVNYYCKVVLPAYSHCNINV